MGYEFSRYVHGAEAMKEIKRVWKPRSQIDMMFPGESGNQ